MSLDVFLPPTAADVRRYLRLDAADATDAEIIALLTVAKGLVADHIGLDIEYIEDLELAHNDYANRAAAIYAAVLLVVGEMYLNREASNANPLSPAVRLILERLKRPSYA